VDAPPPLRRRDTQTRAEQMLQENVNANERHFAQNKEKMTYGVMELIWFGGSLLIPVIWPSQALSDECTMPFKQITIVYLCLLVLVLFPMRIVMHIKPRSAEPRVISTYFGVITLFQMMVAFSWSIYALSMLKYSDVSCWEVFTLQYFNYYF